MSERLVALVDMDCFYCQVETRYNPSLKGKPMAVVQYNQWKGGGIIAVNYEARDRGVTRHMRGEEAKKHCPEIELVSVPCVRGKADLTKYRDAGREVIKVLCQFSETVQRASVDEAFIDLTEAVQKRLVLKLKVSSTQLENTFVVGYTADNTNDEEERAKGVSTWLEEVYNCELDDPELHRLTTAAALVEEMRAAVYDKTGFRCSAGISHNKILAKLVCGIHKPNRQTVLPMSSVHVLYQSLSVKKVRNLGGKLGDDVVERLGITNMAELTLFTEKQLRDKYDEKTANWLYNIARGIDHDPVTPRLIAKSIGCSKNFPGKNALRTLQSVTHWVSELAAEVAERLDEDLHMNKRKAQLVTVHFVQEIAGKDVSMSRSTALPGYDAERIAACVFNVVNKLNKTPAPSEIWDPPLKYLGISTSKFIECTGNSVGSIDKFFKAASTTSSEPLKKQSNCEETCEKTQQNGSHINEKPQQSVAQETSLKDSNNPTITTNTKGSFFERYFKDQPHKIIRRVPLNLPQQQISEVLPVASTQSSSSKHVQPNSRGNMEVDNEISQKKEINSGEFEEGTQNESFISPSEIFPDIENIDESILNILPSPLQRKIASMKESRSETSSLGLKILEKNRILSRESTDSDCAPTRVETVVDIHASSGGLNIASTSSKTVLRLPNKEDREEELEEDAIEPESLFDKTSLDIFELDSNQSSEQEETVQCEMCVKCKKSVLLHELQEHLDHHIAMELHDQLNKQVQPNRTTTSEVRTNKTITVVSDKKKRGRPGKKDAVPQKKSRTILSFFTKT